MAFGTFSIPAADNLQQSEQKQRETTAPQRLQNTQTAPSLAPHQPVQAKIPAGQQPLQGHITPTNSQHRVSTPSSPQITTNAPSHQSTAPAPTQTIPNIQTPVPATKPVPSVVKSQDRRAENQPDNRLLGHVVAVDGGYATLVASANDPAAGSSGFWTIGRLISISVGNSRIVGLVFKIETSQQTWSQNIPNAMKVQIELVGEISQSANGQLSFSRGINVYPPLGSIAHNIRAGDLEAIHNPVGRQTAVIGTLSQDETIPAVVCIDDMIKRHFAIVGSTSTGKSTTVSLLMRKIIEARPNLRILILDPHNEYASAFKDESVTISTDTLELPFWLFQQEEFCEVVFRDRDGVEEEIDCLRDLIPQAKQRFAKKIQQPTSLLKSSGANQTITADTPVPYRMSDLLALMEDEIGCLDGAHNRLVLKSLKNRLESLIADPRYRFMFSQRTVEDNMEMVISNIFRVPINNRPITTFQLTGIPSEVVNSVVAVLARMAFDLAVWSKGNCEVLVMCEEAHRYVPHDHRQGFGPTRRALARIAKEGRKYGAYLGIVTQRPGELDPTILSQCSTVFAMRLANDGDQDIIRSAIPDSSASTMSFLSSIGNREAIAFGEGIATPMRMKFLTLPKQYIPGSREGEDEQGMPMNGGQVSLTSIINGMRNIHTRK